MIHRKTLSTTFSILMLFSLVLVGCSSIGTQSSGSTSTSFTGYGTVTNVTYSETVESTGTIQPLHIVSVNWRTTGTVAQSSAQVGQTVNAGDTLMTLDSATVPANLITAQTDLINAINAVNQLTNPDLSTISNSWRSLSAAYTSYHQAQIDLSNAIISNQNASGSGMYTGWLDTKTALDDAQNNLPLANASIDVQSYYQAVRYTSQIQTALSIAQDSAAVHPTDSALAQKVSDLESAVADSLANQNNLQAGLDAATIDLVSNLSDDLSAFETASTSFIGSVVTNTTGTSVNLAQLQADLAQKQSDLLSAQSTLSDQVTRRQAMNGMRCDETTIADYQTAYDRALAVYNNSAHIVGSREYLALQTAAANITWCSNSYTQVELAAQDADIASTRAQIQFIQAQITADQTQIADATSSVYSLAISLNSVWTAYQDAGQQLSSAVTALYQLERSPNPDDLAAAQARLVAAQASVNSLSLIAPFNGQLTSVNYLPGDAVDNSTPAVTVVDRSQLYIDLSIDESSVVKLNFGDSATIIVESLPTLPITGSVSYINPVGVSNQGVVYYQVRVVLDQSDPQIMLGATADVTIQAGLPQNVLAVPVSAVQNDAQGEFVYRIASDGSSQLVTVVSGQILANDLVIVTGDLAVGDTVGLVQLSTSASGGGFGGGERFMGP
jgi:multidrug efflux pump subunit AcrA (membrane-fusion protein)